MRGALYLLGCALIVAMAFWSYRMNYETQARLDAADQVRRDIADQREAIAVLSAEWAYLNAPARLKRLVETRGASLGLAPMTPDHFADLDEIERPTPDDGMAPVAIIDLDELGAPVALAPAPVRRPAVVATGAGE